MVYLMNALALVELAVWVFQASQASRGSLWGPCSVFLVFTWIFFNIVNWVPWYPGTRGKLGIRLHFQKNIVPLAYLMVLVLGLKLLGLSEWFLLPFVLLVLPMYYVTLILLSFHFRDRSDLRPGYFSHNFYLQEEGPLCTP